jgi:hypothetical protein
LEKANSGSAIPVTDGEEQYKQTLYNQPIEEYLSNDLSKDLLPSHGEDVILARTRFTLINAASLPEKDWLTLYLRKVTQNLEAFPAQFERAPPFGHHQFQQEEGNSVSRISRCWRGDILETNQVLYVDIHLNVTTSPSPTTSRGRLYHSAIIRS